MLILFLINLGYVIDAPNTYLHSKGSYEINARIGNHGAVTTQLNAVVFENFAFGVSYGGDNIIGTEKPVCHKSPGVQVKIASQIQPVSWAVGFDSEEYNDNTKRCLYAVVGGNLNAKIIPSFGINYCKKLNAFAGIETGITSIINLDAEWLLNENQETKKYCSTVNCGIRFKFEDNVVLELFIKDLFGKDSNPSREIKFSYLNFI